MTLLERRRRVLGEDARPTIQTLVDLGHLYSHKEMASKAHELFSEALTLAKRQYEDDDEFVLGIETHLASAYARERRYSEYHRMLTDTYARAQEALGAKHRLTTRIGGRLHAYEQEVTKLKDASRKSKARFDESALKLGVQDPRTVELLAQWVTSLFNSPDVEESTKRVEEYLDLARTEFGERHRETHYAKFHKAHHAHRRMHDSEAEAGYRALLDLPINASLAAKVAVPTGFVLGRTRSRLRGATVSRPMAGQRQGGELEEGRDGDPHSTTERLAIP